MAVAEPLPDAAQQSSLFSAIKKHNRLQTYLPPTILQVEKAKLKLVKKLIDDNIMKHFNNQLEQRLTSLKTKDPSKFSVIKKLFIKDNNNTISHINIPLNSSHIIQNAGLNPELLQKDLVKNNYVQQQQIYK